MDTGTLRPMDVYMVCLALCFVVFGSVLFCGHKLWFL